MYSRRDFGDFGELYIYTDICSVISESICIRSREMMRWSVSKPRKENSLTVRGKGD